MGKYQIQFNYPDNATTLMEYGGSDFKLAKQILNSEDGRIPNAEWINWIQSRFNEVTKPGLNETQDYRKSQIEAIRIELLTHKSNEDNEVDMMTGGRVPIYEADKLFNVILELINGKTDAVKKYCNNKLKTLDKTLLKANKSSTEETGLMQDSVHLEILIYKELSQVEFTQEEKSQLNLLLNNYVDLGGTPKF